MSLAPVAKVFDPGAMPKRWRVEATYRTEGEPLVLVHEVEELEDLGRWIEDGPPWDALIDIRIVWQRDPGHGYALTAEWAGLIRDVYLPKGLCL